MKAAGSDGRPALAHGIGPGDTVLTVGGEGSTHVLATAVHAARLGAKTIAVRWRHDMHAAATEVGARTVTECAEVVTAPNIAVAWLSLIRLRTSRWHACRSGDLRET